MQAEGLDGKWRKLRIDRIPVKKEFSQLHIRARDLFRRLYPCTYFCEELTVKLDNYITVYMDIFVPDYGVAIETQGKQHKEHIRFFHPSNNHFIRAKKLDALKLQWCELNKFELVELLYNENDDEWERKIRQAIGRSE